MLGMHRKHRQHRKQYLVILHKHERILLRLYICCDLIVLAVLPFFYSGAFYNGDLYVVLSIAYMLFEFITIISLNLYINYLDNHSVSIACQRDSEDNQSTETKEDKNDGE